MRGGQLLLVSAMTPIPRTLLSIYLVNLACLSTIQEACKNPKSGRLIQPASLDILNRLTLPNLLKLERPSRFLATAARTLDRCSPTSSPARPLLPRWASGSYVASFY